MQRYKKTSPLMTRSSDRCSPYGTRTRVSTLKGWHPRPLDEGAKPNTISYRPDQQKSRSVCSDLLPTLDNLTFEEPAKTVFISRPQQAELLAIAEQFSNLIRRNRPQRIADLKRLVQDRGAMFQAFQHQISLP